MHSNICSMCPSAETDQIGKMKGDSFAAKHSSLARLIGQI